MVKQLNSQREKVESSGQAVESVTCVLASKVGSSSFFCSIFTSIQYLFICVRTSPREQALFV